MANNFSSTFKKYKGVKVLVTGADGFMGSHLTEKLLKLGADVTVFVRGTSASGTRRGLKNIAHLKSKVRVIAGNIASQDSIDLIAKDKPEIIFHLAAEAYVPKSFTQPLDVFAVNLNGTLNVLEAGRKISGLKRIVVTSSSEIYGSYNGSISEDNLLNPTSPYGSSKVSADRAAYSWFITYGLPVAIIRPFNTYGPRHTYDVIPKFIDMALNNKALTVHGTGKQSRDFTYVSDTINGFLLMGIHPKAVGEIVNFGAGTATTVDQIAKAVVKLTGSKAGIVYDKARLAEVARLTCNWNKAKKLFGWKPEVGLNEGLALNIKWARDNR